MAATQRSRRRSPLLWSRPSLRQPAARIRFWLAADAAALRRNHRLAASLEATLGDRSSESPCAISRSACTQAVRLAPSPGTFALLRRTATFGGCIRRADFLTNRRCSALIASRFVRVADDPLLPARCRRLAAGDARPSSPSRAPSCHLSVAFRSAGDAALSSGSPANGRWLRDSRAAVADAPGLSSAYRSSFTSAAQFDGHDGGTRVA